ncbi:hypothetical protein DSAG12_03494 [Promethearchaeum syntrophicum]|uniref:Chromosome partition protein Smc n=1 Tax=Promethearchaeum syntrophicum TaxID=2594042 RepID=A0A5B9DG60_9ARCH|nr:hypothetical protein [Candidatus Prometheoarchaeum syntrophicum]QEE17657.1 hypothetical protein DSAG12_03494 [Candidatus Prometheoarchaeum syntrophicum]
MQTDNPDEEILRKLEAALDLVFNAESNMKGLFDGLVNIINNTKNNFISLEHQKKILEDQKIELEQKAKKQAKEISGLTNDQMLLLKEYESVKEELEKITRMASGEDEFRIEDMRATLSIYRVLLEEIYSSQPHFKVLFLLHGATDEMTVDQLKGASGIGGVAILRAIHELNRAELINFDEDTHVAKLIKRFFPKKIKNAEKT